MVLQDVFLMIRRKKLTIFTDAKDTTTVLELKRMIEGVIFIYVITLALLTFVLYLDRYFKGESPRSATLQQR